LRGRRAPVPPFGYDDEHPAPAVGWRARKERYGAYADPDAAQRPPSPAMRFLKSSRFTAPAGSVPAEKPLQQPLDGRARPFQRPAVVSSAAVKQKHFRERVKAGKAVLRIEVESHAIEALLEDAGLLPPATDTGRPDVETAVGRLLALLIRDHADASSA
jgi:hypothetical protein